MVTSVVLLLHLISSLLSLEKATECLVLIDLKVSLGI